LERRIKCKRREVVLPLSVHRCLWLFILALTEQCTARVFRRDSPPTRSRSNTGSGGVRSSMLTGMERCLLAMKANE
jgi:hypothetical protein